MTNNGLSMFVMMFKGEKLICTKIFRRKKTIKSLKLTNLVRENFLGTFYLVML